MLTSRAARKLGSVTLPRLAPKLMGPTFGYDLLFHCASEMNHLATFLPALHEEVKDTP